MKLNPFKSGHRILAVQMGLRLFSEPIQGDTPAAIDAATKKLMGSMTAAEREREQMALVWLLSQERADLLLGGPVRQKIEDGTWRSDFEAWLFDVTAEDIIAAKEALKAGNDAVGQKMRPGRPRKR